MCKSTRRGNQQRMMVAMFSNRCWNKMIILRRLSNFWNYLRADILRQSSLWNKVQFMLEKWHRRCSKDSDSASLSINLTISDNGRPIKDMDKAPLYT